MYTQSLLLYTLGRWRKRLGEKERQEYEEWEEKEEKEDAAAEAVAVVAVAESAAEAERTVELRGAEEKKVKWTH